MYACKESNADKYPQPEKPYPKMFPERVPVNDWSGKKDVTDRLTPYNLLYIQHTSVKLDGEDIELTIPRRCMHCDNPPCVKLCPWGAAKQEDNGLSRIDSDLCLGGAKCKTVCPWDIPQRQTGTGLYLNLLPSFAGNGVMYKCDRCYDLLEKGDGRLHFENVKDKMASGNNIAKAMLIAPIAGIAAAAGKFFKAIKEEEE